MNFIKLYAMWIAAAAAAAALAGLYFWVHHDGVVVGRNEVQVKWDAQTVQVEAAKAKLIADNALAIKKLQENADERERKSKTDYDNLRGHADTLALSLRNRPNRPASVGGVPAPASTAQTASGCTGAGLFRDDSEFFTRKFGLAAATLQAALKTCYAQYDAAIAAVNGASP